MRMQVNNITRLKQGKTGVIYCILFIGGVIRDIWTNQRINSFFFFFIQQNQYNQGLLYILNLIFFNFHFSFFFQLLAHSFFKGGDVSGLKKFNPGPVSGISFLFSCLTSSHSSFSMHCNTPYTLKYIEIPSVVN